MQASLVIASFFDTLRTEYSGLPWASFAKYQPGLEFDGGLKKDMVSKDMEEKLRTKSANVIWQMWNREPLRPSQVQGRRFRVREGGAPDPENLESLSLNGFQMKILEIPLTTAFVCPSIEQLETLEEWLAVRELLGLRKTVDILDGPEYDALTAFSFDWNVCHNQVSSIQRMGVDQYGTLFTLMMNTVIAYPCIVDKKVLKLISSIDFRLYIGLPDEVPPPELVFEYVI